MQHQIFNQLFVTCESCSTLEAVFLFKSSVRVSQLVYIVTEVAETFRSGKEVQLYYGEFD